MKILKSLCLLALVSMMYSCSNNIMNEEDPSANLRAAHAEADQNSAEFVKSEHIAGYLDSRAEILYIMPAYQEIALQRMGVATLGANKYEISKEYAEGAVTRQQFSIVNVNERAMIYKLSSIRDYENTSNVVADDPNPIQEPVEGEDYVIYDLAKCTVIWTPQTSPCTNVPNGSIKVYRRAFSKCLTGEDICIEQLREVRRTYKWNSPNCPGGLVAADAIDSVKKMACN